MIPVILIVIALSLFSYLIRINNDNKDLALIELSEKFQFLNEILNESAFASNGEIHNISKSRYNIGQQGSNQIIQIEYYGAMLTITWKYKYFQEETICKENYPDSRYLSEVQQERIAKELSQKLSKKLFDKHGLVQS